MKPHEQCKAAGLSSLAELSEITTVSTRTLINWSKNKKTLFKMIVIGGAYSKVLKKIENY